MEEVFLSGKGRVPNAMLGKAFGYPGTQVRSDIMSATTTPRVFPSFTTRRTHHPCVTTVWVCSGGRRCGYGAVLPGQ